VQAEIYFDIKVLVMNNQRTLV